MPEIFTAPKAATLLVKNKQHQNQSHNILKPDSPSSKSDSLHILSSFIRHPNGLSFTHQEKDEKIILFTRRHIATNFIWALITVIALFVPMILLLFFQSVNLPLPYLPITIKIIFILFYYMLIIGYAFYNFIDWFYNIGIITDKRILDIDFLHLSYIDVAITQLPEIEDVVHRQSGFFASFFNYGDVVAHTVTSREDFVFEHIPHPSIVVEILSKLLSDRGTP